MTGAWIAWGVLAAWWAACVVVVDRLNRRVEAAWARGETTSCTRARQRRWEWRTMYLFLVTCFVAVALAVVYSEIRASRFEVNDWHVVAGSAP